MSSLEDIEIPLLLEGIYQRYGFDFRNYARASLRRRILARAQAENVRSISGLQERVLHDPEAMERFLLGLTVHVTSMFRDPSFYGAFRETVVPLLRTYPFARIWHAGCSTGEEVYSLAILLHEEGLYERCRLYATDLSEVVLKVARAGVYPLAAMKEFTANYQHAGGNGSFSEYYSANDESAIVRPFLQQNIVFAQHNLVTDASFNEFHVVFCRNVMIYFNKTLQEQVHRLLHQSLVRLGVLALGRRESLQFSGYESCYAELQPKEKLYRKVQ
jgi:chemotaxis protein methyltransferase CheR